MLKQKPLWKSKIILFEKLKESLRSTMPIVAIVFLIAFTFLPISASMLLAFLLCSFLLVLGMGLFTLGADLSMSPMGNLIGASMTKSKKVWVVVLVSFIIGCLATVSEPDLIVLAGQISAIPNITLILTVAIGVGVFLVVAMLRSLFKIPLSYLLIALYLLTFILAFFVPQEFLALAFDSGGVTTGPMTVPFILALGVGVGATRSDKNAEDDSFGLVALCSIGPIISVLILGLIFSPQNMTIHPAPTPDFSTSFDIGAAFAHTLPQMLKEIAIAIAPITAFFVLYNFISLRLPLTQILKIFIGLAYTYFGLVLFLSAVNVGFLPIGNFLGASLASLPQKWVLIPLGMLMGYFIVMAEPAVHILKKQVFDLTSGTIPQKLLTFSLSIGVAVAIGIAMLRTILDINLLWILIPGYSIALILSFFVPRIFTAIAFDSGGVASGPMTATFLLPLAIGAASSSGGNTITNAFGLVALVAMTPLISVQILGAYYKFKTRVKSKPITTDTEEIIDNEDIIDF